MGYAFTFGLYNESITEPLAQKESPMNTNAQTNNTTTTFGADCSVIDGAWGGVASVLEAIAALAKAEAKALAIAEQASACGIDCSPEEASFLASVGFCRQAVRVTAAAYAAMGEADGIMPSLIEDGGTAAYRIQRAAIAAAILVAAASGSGGGLVCPGAGTARAVTSAFVADIEKALATCPAVAAQGGKARANASSGPAWTAAYKAAAEGTSVSPASYAAIAALAEAAVVVGHTPEEAAEKMAIPAAIATAEDVARRTRLVAIAHAM